MSKRESAFDMMGSAERKKKRRSRWAAPEEKEKTAGMPVVIPQGLTREQEEQYLLQLQIEEISRRLRTGDLGIPPNPEERSPSPEPIYNNEGKRLNTREYRTRKKLEEERHSMIQKSSQMNPEYKPPADYKPPVIRVNDKVMIPQEEHPDINFVGLLIGPRGNTLKNLEKETGAKIIIRGKGSVKEGKIGRKDGQPLPGEDEPLHAYVTANNPENVRKAVDKIKEIIKQGIDVPEGENDLRRQQLRELALLNGTLRENDALGKLKQIQQAQTIVTNTILCSVCGGAGHIAQDCKAKRPGDSFRAVQNQSAADKAKMDSEYMSLMAELGEGPPPQQKSNPQPLMQPPGSSPGSRFNAPPPGMNGQSWGHGNKPPGLMSLQVSQNAPSGVPPPPHVSMPSQPPPYSMPPAPNPGGPPPQSSNAGLPPWQQSMPISAPPAPSTSMSSNMGVPPPNMMAPPPPPPPSSQAPATSTYPWQPPAPAGAMSVPPPPPPSGVPPPWQQPSSNGVAPVPPPPPGNMPPWQQSAPPLPGGMQPPMGQGVPPPPPPPGGFSQQSAPPPPPSSGFSMPNLPFGVPPPPPPS